MALARSLLCDTEERVYFFAVQKHFGASLKYGLIEVFLKYFCAAQNYFYMAHRSRHRGTSVSFAFALLHQWTDLSGRLVRIIQIRYHDII